MSYSIIGTGTVGRTFATLCAKARIEVGLTNTSGADSVEPVANSSAARLCRDRSTRPWKPTSSSSPSVSRFQERWLGKADWTGKIVVDVTNAAFLPQEVQDRELQGRLSSEASAERVPGAKLVKAFNQLPMKVLSRPVPPGGKRVVFISSDYEDASASVARLTAELGFTPIELGRIGEGGRLIQSAERARVPGPSQVRRHMRA